MNASNLISILSLAVSVIISIITMITTVISCNKEAKLHKQDILAKEMLETYNLYIHTITSFPSNFNADEQDKLSFVTEKIKLFLSDENARLIDRYTKQLLRRKKNPEYEEICQETKQIVISTLRKTLKLEDVFN